MTNLKKIASVSVAAAVFASVSLAFAQDDLDDLLKDLESDLAAETAKKAAPAAPAEEPAAEPAAEEGVGGESGVSGEGEAKPAAEEPAAEESAEEEPAAEPAVEEGVSGVSGESGEGEAKPAAGQPAAEESAEEEPAAEEGVSGESGVSGEGEPTPLATPAPLTPEEPATEESTEEAEPAAEEEPAAGQPAAATTSLLGEIAAETPAPAAEPAAEEGVSGESGVSGKGEAKPLAAAVPAAPADPDAELLDNLRTTERLRREAYDAQAKREIVAARESMSDGAYADATRYYGNALKLLNDSPSTKALRRECEQGIAESQYRAALEEERLGRRESAIELMEKAKAMRHPKARRQLEAWSKGENPNANKTDLADVKHRRNDKDYKEQRDKNRRHLRRARQLLSVRDIDQALDECEIVLKYDPYNQEALRLRGAIQKKRALILGQEFNVTRDAMIADVDRAWRPVYAPNARQLEESASTTIRNRTVGDDPERSIEQSIIQRMKEMTLPTISFKPPATIIDAVDYFRGASKDFDRPDIPLEERGFNFVLKTPETLLSQAAAADDDSDDGFASTGDDSAAPSGPAGVPVIPMITANAISFYDALKLVCDSVDYKFKVQGPVVMVMHKDIVTEEMITRSYPVVAAFLERMGSASSDIKEMKSAGFGGGSSSRSNDDSEESQERDWKEFFSLMGVQWPEGSSILYIKTIGKLRVKNTYENLAELEKALTELNVDQKLIEIEARFVEVSQQDLNSLGFEWILNSNYTLGSGGWLGRHLGLKKGGYAEGYTVSPKTKYTMNADSTITTTVEPNYQSNGEVAWRKTGLSNDLVNKTPVRLNNGIAGVDSFGGENSQYGQGQRYLSQTGNAVSGQDKSSNDQFMRVNAFLGSADLSMILHMLSQRTDTDLLSAPKVLTRPGENAVIKVVTEYIYPTDYNVQLQSSSSSSSGNNGGSQSAILAVVEPEQFEMREVGVILDVTPTLTDDGNLIDLKFDTRVVDEPTWKNYGMKIPYSGNSSSLQSFQGIGEIFTSLSDLISSVGGELSASTRQLIVDSATSSAMSAMDSLSSTGEKNMTYYEAPMEQPFFHMRKIESSVSIFPGATMVMGGLITESRQAMDDKIPFLGDLPFVGRLFRSHAEQTIKKNLLIFVTTRLVDVRGREVSVSDNGETSADVPAPDKAAN